MIENGIRLMQFIKITYMPITTFLRAAAVEVYEKKQLVGHLYKQTDKLSASGLYPDPMASKIVLPRIG